MTITEYIKELETLRGTVGDIEVFQGAINTTLGCIQPARLPRIEEVAFLTSREQNARIVLTHEKNDLSRLTGRKIVYVGR